ncbi:MAG: tRNA (adenosine(37)-N6)-threonylcarbamoyltransferase complex ATPase subunit type 1 TsaE [Candidatus Kerfeldbacteria bacterium]|nr:tRNA (adenosine(37)-N6)-threonylcarbamoyltransferase complex ATPase subunit type 1 TsaE [Candidatus Kerfeldbacteria bacterium]
MSVSITQSAKETQKLAAKLAQNCRGGEVFCLSGELGAGKTTFVQGFAKALGIAAAITSPTFVLEKIYPIRTHSTVTRLVHVDAYRIGTDATPPLDLTDHLNDPHTIVLIEWPDHLSSLLQNVEYNNVTFRVVDPGEREIEIKEYYGQWRVAAGKRSHRA